ncbi:MAG: recombination mediator RecR [Candidatus Omnitrophota bacterium]|nr:recombination protein RecR [Candidatus Omnitrophota bacterium]MBU3929345.1 recombination mediator RecR [bacterium]MBU4122460.1 recombination mediator RecR [bacterium]
MSNFYFCVERLKEAFYALPSVTPKFAAKLASDFIKLPPESRKKLLDELREAEESIRVCSVCGNYSSEDVCDICADKERDTSIICVVEEVMDVSVVEDAGFNGMYHILGGRIDPLNKILPENLNIESLFKRLESGAVKEVILATNLNRKGIATARYIYNEIARRFGDIKISHPAHGLSEGSEIIYVNAHTLKEALEGRRSFE